MRRHSGRRTVCRPQVTTFIGRVMRNVGSSDNGAACSDSAGGFGLRDVAYREAAGEGSWFRHRVSAGLSSDSTRVSSAIPPITGARRLLTNARGSLELGLS